MTGSALVVGAGGAVGEAVTHALLARGWRVTASMRTMRPAVQARLQGAGAGVVVEDVAQRDWIAHARACDVMVFSTHLALTVQALERAGLQTPRVVAFSSNNVATHPEAAAYRELATAEQRLQAIAPGAAIIRPTLIYGDPRLSTLSRVMRMARRWPFMPMPGSGRARVQPVFHEDLGRLAAGLAGGDGGIYAAGGPDVVTMRALFERVAEAADGRARPLAIPAALLQLGAPALNALGLFSADQAARADEDRLVVAQTPLPASLQPNTPLREGLRRLAAALNADVGSPARG